MGTDRRNVNLGLFNLPSAVMTSSPLREFATHIDGLGVLGERMWTWVLKIYLPEV
jgi:hypothetical protein